MSKIFLNATVKFEAYGAQVPRAATDVERESEGECTIHGTPALSRGCAPDLYMAAVDQIWKEFTRDVVDLKLLPHELLFVMPLVKSNPAADEFRTRLHEFWVAHLEDPDVRAAALRTAVGRTFYEIYDSERRPRWFAYLHRSDEGRPVDTTLSEWASRGTSIHSAQGDGRRLVYVIGLSESALKCFSRGRRDVLEYESLWTVLMSRAKHRLRIFVERKYDDAWVRLKPFMSEATQMEVAPTFRLGTRPDLQRIDLGNDYGSEDANSFRFRDMQEAVVLAVEAAQQSSVSDEHVDGFVSAPQMVEDLHHDIRMAIYHFAFLARMLRDEAASSRKRQICTILSKASKLECRRCTSARDYHQGLRGIIDKEECQKLEFFPVLEDPRMPDACRKFERYVEKAKEAMKLLLGDPEDCIDLDDTGMLVFYHLLDIFTRFQYAHSKIDMIYDLLDAPRSRHDEGLRPHYADVMEAARRAANELVSDSRISGETREWKLNHQLQLHTGDGGQPLRPRFNVPFLGFTENAAVVVLLTPRLDASNITKIAGHAIATALLLEHPVDKDVNRVRSCAEHWLCVAPLEGARIVWVDVRDLLCRNRGAAVAWLVGFLADACKQTHPEIEEFYQWHLKNGSLPEAILGYARKRVAGQSVFVGSYVEDTFKLMEDRAEAGDACHAKVFERSLNAKMNKEMAKARKWLSGHEDQRAAVTVMAHEDIGGV